MEVVASALGVASFGIQVCQGSVQYIEAWQGYSADMQQMKIAVQNLGRILAALKVFLGNDRIDSAHRDIAVGCLKGCFEGLRCLKKKAAALQSTNRSKARLLRSWYPIKKQSLDGIRALVGQLTDQLQLALTLIQLSEDDRRHATVLMEIRKDRTTRTAAVTASSSDALSSLSMPPSEALDHIAMIPHTGDETTIHFGDRLSESQMSQLRCFMSAMNIRTVRVMSGAGLNDVVPEERTAMLEYVCPHDLQDNLLQEYICQRMTGTVEWFFQLQSFRLWIHRGSDTLLCHGAAGTGKSVMAAAAIEHLFSAVHCTNSPVVYVYCGYDKGVSAKRLIGSLLRQILALEPYIPSALRHLLDRQRNGGATPTTVELEDVLLEVVRGLRKLLIVTDALDECDERVRYLSAIRRLQEECNVRHLMFTRKTPDLYTQLESPVEVDITPFGPERELRDTAAMIAWGQKPKELLPLCLQHLNVAL